RRSRAGRRCVAVGSPVYFSSVSENTHRFVQRLDLPALGMDVQRIPLRPTEGFLRVAAPYVLMVPTYGGGTGDVAVPRQVVKFLNDVHYQSLIRGVVAAGNTKFGDAYCIAGDIISAKCQMPYLYAFELLGTAEDAVRVRDVLG